MKYLIIISLFIIHFSTNCQVLDYESILKDNEKAKKYCFKEINFFEINNSITNKKNLSLYKEYNKDTNLSYMINYKYYNKNDFQETYISYDELKRINKITILISFLKNYKKEYNFYYDDNSNLIKEAIFKDDYNFTKYDTIYFQYKNNVKYLSYYTNKKDTTYYYYDSIHNESYKSNLANDTINTNKYNENGCRIFYSNEPEDERHTVIYDDLCNELEWKEELLKDGVWNTFFYRTNKYNNKDLIETKYYSWNKKLYNKHGKLVFVHHKKYEYDTNHNLIKVAYLNKSEKLINYDELLYNSKNLCIRMNKYNRFGKLISYKINDFVFYL